MRFKITPQNFLHATCRFPIPTLLSLLFCILSVNRPFEDVILWKYLSILFCGFFWFIALKLLMESYELSNKLYYGVGIPIFLSLAWYLNTEQTTPWLLMSALFLSIFIAPYLNKHSSSQQLWEWGRHMFMHIGLTIVATLILWLGTISIISSLSFLFGINFYDLIYFDAWLLAATLFAPIIAMSGIPERFNTEGSSYPKAIFIILSYILMPLLLLYGLILYAYIAKILVSWSLPKGGVAYLVSAFGSIGIAAYLAGHPKHKDSGIIGFFTRNFFKILLVPLALFAIAIGVRVYEYGITERRYTLLLCFTWLTASALFTILKGNTSAPKFILSSIVVLLLAASFGPFGAVKVSGDSQLHRLLSLLAQNEMLVDGKIHAPKHKLNYDDARNISSIVHYLADTKKEGLLKPWFDDSDRGAILEKIGISTKVLDNFNYTNWSAPYTNVSGYDYYIIVGADQVITLGDSGIKLSAKLDNSTKHYVVTINDTNRIDFALDGLINQLTSGSQINPVLEKESGNIKVRIIVKDLHSEPGVISYFNAIILVKTIKQS